MASVDRLSPSPLAWEKVGEQPPSSIRKKILGRFPLPWETDTFGKDLRKWIDFEQVRKDLFSGLAVAVAQVPEAVSFAFVAGVPPIVGLYGGFWMGLITSIFGGRPGMISGATGALAIVQAELMHDTHGDIELLFGTMLVTGAIQMLVGIFDLGRFISMVSLPVMTGFVNGLAIVIFIAQLSGFQLVPDQVGFTTEELFAANSSLYSNFTLSNFQAAASTLAENVTVTDVSIMPDVSQLHVQLSELPMLTETTDALRSTAATLAEVTLERLPMEFSNIGSFVFGIGAVQELATPEPYYVDGTTIGLMIMLIVITMAIAHFFPYATTSIPSSLVAVIVVTIIEHAAGLDTITVGDKSSLSGALPTFHVPVIEMTSANWLLMIQYGSILAAIGLLESLLTAQVVADLTNTSTDVRRECFAQGLGNFVCGWFGAMGGCATIGQSIINIASGGRGRISSFTASMILFFIIIGLNVVIELVPLASLIGIMFIVVLHTFSWSSLMLMYRSVRIHTTISITNCVTIILVTVVTLIADLAVAVGVGLLFESLIYCYDMSKRLHGKRSTEVVPGTPSLKPQPEESSSSSDFSRDSSSISVAATSSASAVALTNPGKTALVGVIEEDGEEEEVSSDGLTVSKMTRIPISVGHLTLYKFHGPLFFASTNSFNNCFSPLDDDATVVCDLTQTFLADLTGIEVLNSVMERYEREEKQIHFIGLRPKMKRYFRKLGGSMEALHQYSKLSRTLVAAAGAPLIRVKYGKTKPIESTHIPFPTKCTDKVFCCPNEVDFVDSIKVGICTIDPTYKVFVTEWFTLEYFPFDSHPIDREEIIGLKGLKPRHKKLLFSYLDKIPLDSSSSTPTAARVPLSDVVTTSDHQPSSTIELSRSSSPSGHSESSSYNEASKDVSAHSSSSQSSSSAADSDASSTTGSAAVSDSHSSPSASASSSSSSSTPPAPRKRKNGKKSE
eukprot:TRINITY_DN2722_c0_g1_i1.p1 TRINITY_DN2722_c0_g1~~TRINITY_DN2722_c0_g1_i1.p1  ORF type:complete len:968 (+),score=241.77 TRINITY_DN2722_c0_g1_i1:34-2904(+)